MGKGQSKVDHHARHENMQNAQRLSEMQREINAAEQRERQDRLVTNFFALLELILLAWCRLL